MDILTFVLSSVITSSVVICKVVAIVSMETGDEVIAMTVDASDAVVVAWTIEVDCMILLSVKVLTAVLLKARSLPVLTMPSVD